MKFSFYQRSFILCLCAIFCLAATIVQACAQSQPQTVFLELKAGNRELRVFDNGTLVETRHGKTTERRLSEKKMKKLRQVIASQPCVKEWQQLTSPAPALASEVITLAPQAFNLSTTYFNDCTNDLLSSGFGLDEILVTIPSISSRIGTIPVYVVCNGAKESVKKYAKRNYQSSLKPSWQRFLADVSKVVGSKSFLKGCDLWQN